MLKDEGFGKGALSMGRVKQLRKSLKERVDEIVEERAKLMNLIEVSPQRDSRKNTGKWKDKIDYRMVKQQKATRQPYLWETPQY